MLLAMATSASGLPPGGRACLTTTRAAPPNPTSTLPTTRQVVGALVDQPGKADSHTTSIEVVGCGNCMGDKYQVSLKPTCSTGKAWTTCTLLNSQSTGNKALVSGDVKDKLSEAGEHMENSMEPAGTLPPMPITTLHPKQWPTELPFPKEHFFEDQDHRHDTSDFWTSFTWDSFVSSIPTGTGIVVIPPYDWSSTPTPTPTPTTMSTTSSKKASTSSSSTISELQTSPTLITTTSAASLPSTSSQTQSLSESTTSRSSTSTSTSSLGLTPTSANAVVILTSEITVYPTATAHTTTNGSGPSPLSVGAKVGIGAGSAAGFLAFASVIAYAFGKKNHKHKRGNGSSPSSNTGSARSSSLASLRRCRRRDSLELTERIHGMSAPSSNHASSSSSTNNHNHNHHATSSDRSAAAVPAREGGGERAGPPHAAGHAQQECPYEGHCSVHDPLRAAAAAPVPHHPRRFGMWGSRRTRSGQLVAELQAMEPRGSGHDDSAVGRSQIPIGRLSRGSSSAQGGQAAAGQAGQAGRSELPSSAADTSSEPLLQSQARQTSLQIQCPRPRATMPPHWQSQMELLSVAMQHEQQQQQQQPAYAPILSRSEPARPSGPGSYYDAVNCPYSLWRQQPAAELDGTPVEAQQSQPRR